MAARSYNRPQASSNAPLLVWGPSTQYGVPMRVAAVGDTVGNVSKSSNGVSGGAVILCLAIMAVIGTAIAIPLAMLLPHQPKVDDTTSSSASSMLQPLNFMRTRATLPSSLASILDENKTFAQRLPPLPAADESSGEAASGGVVGNEGSGHEGSGDSSWDDGA